MLWGIGFRRSEFKEMRKFRVQIKLNMGTIELKSNLHKIVDKINNEELLRTIYDFLKVRENLEERQIWKALTEEQKKEVYLSYEESEDDRNLVSWDEVTKASK